MKENRFTTHINIACALLEELTDPETIIYVQRQHATLNDKGQQEHKTQRKKKNK